MACDSGVVCGVVARIVRSDMIDRLDFEALLQILRKTSIVSHRRYDPDTVFQHVTLSVLLTDDELEELGGYLTDV